MVATFKEKTRTKIRLSAAVKKATRADPNYPACTIVFAESQERSLPLLRDTYFSDLLYIKLQSLSSLKKSSQVTSNQYL